MQEGAFPVLWSAVSASKGSPTMSSFTLDDIRAAADKKYGATEIIISDDITVNLVNPLRLKKKDREALVAVQDKLSGEGDEQTDHLELLSEAIMIVADDKGAAQILLDTVGEDLALIAQIFSTYIDGTSAGEASASAA